MLNSNQYDLEKIPRKEKKEEGRKKQYNKDQLALKGEIEKRITTKNYY
jgi:hypothetical protein